MRVSRELDALIAERVMGWELDDLPEGVVWEGNSETGGGVTARTAVPRYSTDIAAAWEVVEKIRGAGFTFSLWDNANQYAAPWDCRFTHRDDVGQKGIAIEGTAPHAICLAALRAKGVEIPE